MNTFTPVKIGEAFNPADVIRMKMYPVDVVDSRPDIGDGPKRLYAQLFRIAIAA